MTSVDNISTFGVTPTGLTAPDSITTGDGSFFVEYGNGAVSTGGSGSSTIIQYDAAGKVRYTYDIAGSVDGLKYNPTTGKVWALQNQDGNSTLSLIDPKTHTVSAPIQFANASATRGYDDVVFKGDRVFLSYTNPSADASPKNAPTLVELIGGESAIGKGPLITQPILSTASTGVDTVTGKTGIVPQIDPDSLKMAPNGDLIFSSGDGGVIVDVHNPGDGAKQTVSYTPIKGMTAGSAGLDDVIKTNASSGTFYVADAKGDRVQSFHVSGLNANDFYAAVGNAFGQIDPKTGVFTALVSSKNDPGFGSAHGVTFVADKPAAAPEVSDIHTFGVTPTGLTKPDSLTMGDGSMFVEYGNGADPTGASGSSTIIQYNNAGNVEYTYSVAGSVDGLKFNPTTGKVWALQNEDGNSTLTLIDPKTHAVSAPIQFANASPSRGFDDVVFKGNRVFLSYTNPSSDASPNDAPTIVELIGGESALGKGALLTQPILTTAATGVNTVTGKTTVVPQIDPDSLKLAANGDLIFTSGDGGDIIAVHNPGDGAKQTMSYTPIKGVTAGSAGLDDVIKPTATSGTFYVSDQTGDRVVSFHATGLKTNDYYASIGGAQNAFGQIDPKTGKFTALISNANDPGFGSPHGVAFVADSSTAAGVKPVAAMSGGSAQAAALLNQHMASSFVGAGIDSSTKVIADPHVSNPVLASPRHA